MYKFIPRNQKKMLAVFGVLLMIVFVLPASLGQGGILDPLEGRLADGGKTRRSDKKQADSDVDVLSRHNLLPLVLNLAPYEVYTRPEMGRMAAGLAQQLHENPELWVMLVREAEQAGIRPPEVEVKNLVEQTVDP